MYVHQFKCIFLYVLISEKFNENSSLHNMVFNICILHCYWQFCHFGGHSNGYNNYFLILEMHTSSVYSTVLYPQLRQPLPSIEVCFSSLSSSSFPSFVSFPNLIFPLFFNYDEPGPNLTQPNRSLQRMRSSRHRWELTVLRYHRIRINYLYPFWGVIFGVILHDFIRQNYRKTSQIVTLFSSLW